jgi:hypothetical protein
MGCRLRATSQGRRVVQIPLEGRAVVGLDGQLPEIGRAVGAFAAYLQSLLFDCLDFMVG